MEAPETITHEEARTRQWPRGSLLVNDLVEGEPRGGWATWSVAQSRIVSEAGATLAFVSTPERGR